MIVSIDKDEARLFKIMTEHYLDSILIFDAEDVNLDDSEYIVPKSGVFKEELLLIADVKGIDGKCVVTTLYGSLAIVIKSPVA